MILHLHRVPEHHPAHSDELAQSVRVVNNFSHVSSPKRTGHAIWRMIMKPVQVQDDEKDKNEE
jgi:hypothetical protein